MSLLLLLASQPPVGARLVVCVLLVVGGAVVSIYGWKHAADERRLLGSLLIFAGTLLHGCGLFLWLVLLDPRTWSWGF